MTLTPGARYFLAQRKAQGITDVTDAQADALAALMVAMPVAAPVVRSAVPERRSA